MQIAATMPGASTATSTMDPATWSARPAADGLGAGELGAGVLGGVLTAAATVGTGLVLGASAGAMMGGFGLAVGAIGGTITGLSAAAGAGLLTGTTIAMHRGDGDLGAASATAGSIGGAIGGAISAALLLGHRSVPGSIVLAGGGALAGGLAGLGVASMLG